MPTSPLRSPVAAKLRATNNPRTPPCSTETQFDDLDCCGLLGAGRGRLRQSCGALNLGLEAVANEILKFGGLDRDHGRELWRTQTVDIPAAAHQLTGRTQRSIV